MKKGTVPKRRKQKEISLTLTPREQQIYNLVITGKQNKEVAGALRISTHTVKAFMRLIYLKKGMKNRSILIAQGKINDASNLNFG